VNLWLFIIFKVFLIFDVKYLKKIVFRVMFKTFLNFFGIKYFSNFWQVWFFTVIFFVLNIKILKFWQKICFDPFFIHAVLFFLSFPYFVVSDFKCFLILNLRLFLPILRTNFLQICFFINFRPQKLEKSKIFVWKISKKSFFSKFLRSKIKKK
jgi:hypothetical protein